MIFAAEIEMRIVLAGGEPVYGALSFLGERFVRRGAYLTRAVSFNRPTGTGRLTGPRAEPGLPVSKNFFSQKLDVAPDQRQNRTVGYETSRNVGTFEDG